MFSDLRGSTIRWKVTTIVEQESRTKIKQLDAYLQHVLKELYTTVRSEHKRLGKPELDFDPGDLNLIQEFFLVAMQRGSEPQKLCLEYLETFIVSGIQDAQKRGRDAKKSFTWLGAELRTMIGNTLLRLDTIVVDIVGHGRSPDGVNKLKPELGTMKESDLFVLAEVKEYSQSTGLKCLLASVDYTDFITNRVKIEATTGVICCDPLYLLTRYNGL